MTTISDTVPKVSNTNSDGFAPNYKIHNDNDNGVPSYVRCRLDYYNSSIADDYERICDEERIRKEESIREEEGYEEAMSGLVEMIHDELVPHLITKYGNEYSEAINSLTNVLLSLDEPIVALARIKWAFSIPANQLYVRNWSRSSWYWNSPHDNDCEDYGYERYLKSKNINNN